MGGVSFIVEGVRCKSYLFVLTTTDKIVDRKYDTFLSSDLGVNAAGRDKTERYNDQSITNCAFHIWPSKEAETYF